MISASLKGSWRFDICFPIIYSGDAPNTIAGFNRLTSKNCSANSLNDFTFAYPLPTCYLQSKDANKIQKYIHSSSFPTATIYKSSEVKYILAPVVASFSFLIKGS
uniref:Cucumisin-like n=1 Tax=Cicer arietinum TaxID=3827 RepID=A0A3Q7XSX5_CICAR|nr:cucumisin-like [Cicer arietinum]